MRIRAKDNVQGYCQTRTRVNQNQLNKILDALSMPNGYKLWKQ